MRSPRLALVHCCLLISAALLAGCASDDPVAPVKTPVVATPMPDFTLPDVNPTSVTFNQGVSPRDHLQKVSAWYFGHST